MESSNSLVPLPKSYSTPDQSNNGEEHNDQSIPSQIDHDVNNDGETDSEDNNPNDLHKEVSNYYKKDKGDETDTEDGLNWQFEDDSPFTFHDVDRSITDGDDHRWSGDQDILHGGGSWRHVVGSLSVLGKQRTLDQYLDTHTKNPVEVSQASPSEKWPHTMDSEVIDLTYSSPPPEITEDVPTIHSPLCSSSPIQYESGDEQELDDYIQQIQKKADAFKEAAQILRSQIQFKNQIWMKPLSDRKFGRDVMDFVDDIRVYEKTGKKRKATWAEGPSKSE
ncbi:hypothetical protein C0995_007135 [Termitomyces sp. Mi166|nr:hypothetical protein C0995_007135 [Termitomyces sp. Mi166\